MLGSCCEEQEAQEAAERARIRAITAHTEARLMHGSLQRKKIENSLRCMDPCCIGVGCEECEEETPAPSAEEQKKASGDTGSDESDDFDDDDDDEIIARMRASRLGEMRASAESETRRRAALGTHARLQADALRPLLVEGATSAAATPLVVHLAVEEDAEATGWVEDALRRAGSSLPMARLVTVVCPPEGCAALPRARPPTLLLVERGCVTRQCEAAGPSGPREPEALRGAIESWVESARAKLTRQQLGAESSDEEDEPEQSYCGRPGCRAYAHEHVAGGTHDQFGDAAVA